MVSAVNTIDEVTILSRAIRPDAGDWPVDIANGIMSISLSEADRVRMNELAGHAAAGSLSPDEESEIEKYRQVTRLLELLKAKARVSLARSIHRT
jgi:hypothetical protein